MVDEQGCLRDELDPRFASPRHVAYDEEEIVFFSDHSGDDDHQSSSDDDSSCFDYFTAGGDKTDEEEWHDAFDNCSNDHPARSLFEQEDDSCCEDNKEVDDFDDLGLIGEMDSIHLRKSQLLEEDDFEKTAFGVFGEKDSLHRRGRAAKFLRQKAITNSDLEQQLDGPFGEHDSLHGRTTYRKISTQIAANEMKILAQDEKEETEGEEEIFTPSRKQPHRLLMRRVSQEEEKQGAPQIVSKNSQEEQIKLLSSLGATDASRTCINKLDEYLFKILETMEDEMHQRYHGDGDDQDTRSCSGAMDSSSRTNYYTAAADESDYDGDGDCVSLYNWEDDEPSEASSSSDISKGMADAIIPPLPALPERIPRQDARAA
eukprot:CAMPEP_0195290032 /NCGR_PEP_ID=MMETSP0707-20130614/6056_1 /TAXON_ID=33640 /ORGANISM="Asterionellopsis glacialis, Strain CCMP134" /LENGTH=372 /DNA_ID=CAMNT_0040350099 /DNA_START=136 /DNA_END=1254 /DNA_ORIENTATION=-